MKQNDTQDNPKAPIITYTPDQLDQALYHATDIAGRCLLPFVLLGEIAHDIKYHQALNENTAGIDIGAAERYFTAEVLSNLRTFAKGSDLNLGIKDYTEDDKGFLWTYNHVPIRLRMIKRNYSFFNNPDFAWYMAEEYKIPNPFDVYWKSRFLIR